MESEILQSILEEMNRQKTKYTEVVNEINQKASQIEQLKIDIRQLSTQKDQTAGQYTALYNQYQKFMKKDVATSVSSETVTETNSIENNKEDSTPAPDSIEPTPVKKNKTSKLSKAEIEKLKKVTETSAVDNKGNEIPEYLTSEYSK